MTKRGLGMIKIKEQILYDEKGNKKSVLLNYREYEALLEDLHDLAAIAERSNEKPISHEEMMERLKKDGLV